MNTEEIMNLSLELSGLTEVPSDSQIYVTGEKISNLLFCLDAGAAELMFAKKQGFDAVVAHHPAGNRAILHFPEVFKRHTHQMVEAGIPREEATKTVAKKMNTLDVQAHTRNYAHNVDIANLLKMPFMNIHTPLDEIGRNRMKEQIRSNTESGCTVEQVVSSLKRLKEFKHSLTEIKVRMGNPENPAGRVVVSHGAGTNGGYEIANKYFEYGIGTVVYIHISHSDLEKLRAEALGNLIITGHVASDSLGINPMIRELESRNISVTRIGIVPDRERNS